MAQHSFTSQTAGFTFQSWAAFAISLGATSLGIMFLDAGLWERAFLGLGLWFTVSSTITLSKAMRDKHESDKLVNRIEEARAEAVLREVGREAA